MLQSRSLVKKVNNKINIDKINKSELTKFLEKF